MKLSAAVLVHSSKVCSSFSPRSESALQLPNAISVGCH